MATWTIFCDTDPAITGSPDASPSGTVALDESTKPADFDNDATVNSIRIHFQMTGAGFSDDTWQVATTAVVLRASSATDAASITPGSNTGLGNQTVTVDLTDNSPVSTGSSYQGSLVLSGVGGGNRLWALISANMKADGCTVDVEGGSAETFVVIDYTPAGASPVSIALTPATATVSAQALDLSLSAHSHALVAATAVAAAQALSPSLGAHSTALSPATAIAAAQAFDLSLGALSLPLTPATAAVTAQPLDLFLPREVALVQATTSVAAQPLGVSLAAAQTDLVAAGATVAAQPLALSLTALSTALVAATGTTAAQVLDVQVAGAPVEIALASAVANASAQTLDVGLGAATTALIPTLVTAAAQELGITTDPLSLALVAATATAAPRILDVSQPGVGPPAERSERNQRAASKGEGLSSGWR